MTNSPQDEPELPPIVADPALINRRKAMRRRVFLTGRIHFGSYRLDCCIRDISAGGARVGLSKGQTIPDRFDLIEVRDGIGHEAAIVGIGFHADAPELHVRFVNTYAVSDKSYTSPDLLDAYDRARLRSEWR